MLSLNYTWGYIVLYIYCMNTKAGTIPPHTEEGIRAIVSCHSEAPQIWIWLSVCVSPGGGGGVVTVYVWECIYRRKNKVGNFSPAMGARNRVGIGLSYRPASLCSLATQFQTRLLESIPRPIAGLKFPTLETNLQDWFAQSVNIRHILFASPKKSRKQMCRTDSYSPWISVILSWYPPPPQGLVSLAQWRTD